MKKMSISDYKLLCKTSLEARKLIKDKQYDEAKHIINKCFAYLEMLKNESI